MRNGGSATHGTNSCAMCVAESQWKVGLSTFEFHVCLMMCSTAKSRGTHLMPNTAVKEIRCCARMQFGARAIGWHISRRARNLFGSCRSQHLKSCDLELRTPASNAGHSQPHMTACAVARTQRTCASFIVLCSISSGGPIHLLTRALQVSLNSKAASTTSC